MLLRLTGGKTASYIYWCKPPATVTLREGGVLIVPCRDQKGGWRGQLF